MYYHVFFQEFILAGWLCYYYLFVLLTAVLVMTNCWCYNKLLVLLPAAHAIKSWLCYYQLFVLLSAVCDIIICLWYYQLFVLILAGCPITSCLCHYQLVVGLPVVYVIISWLWYNKLAMILPAGCVIFIFLCCWPLCAYSLSHPASCGVVPVRGVEHEKGVVGQRQGHGHHSCAAQPHDALGRLDHLKEEGERHVFIDGSRRRREREKSKSMNGIGRKKSTRPVKQSLWTGPGGPRDGIAGWADKRKRRTLEVYPSFYRNCIRALNVRAWP